MTLLPFVDRRAIVRLWADRKSNWLVDSRGKAFALIACDGVFNLNGRQIGWWYGDHVRDKFGRIILCRMGSKLEGATLPRVTDRPRPPKIQSLPAHPALNWASKMPPPKQFGWSDFDLLSDHLERRLGAFFEAAKRVFDPNAHLGPPDDDPTWGVNTRRPT